jgi:hypothetical protein
MSPERTYRLFIAHAWVYNEEYHRLFRYLNEMPDFKYEDSGDTDIWSFGEEKPSREEMRKQILPAEVVLVVSDVYAKTGDEWIPYILEEAESQGKPIIAIDSWGPQTISPEIVEKAVEIVYWDAEKITDAIRRHAR